MSSFFFGTSLRGFFLGMDDGMGLVLDGAEKPLSGGGLSSFAAESLWAPMMATAQIRCWCAGFRKADLNDPRLFSSERTIEKTFCRAASSAQRRISAVLPAQECQVGKAMALGRFF